MSDVTEKALAAIQREQLLCPNDTVFVALSGGADSMALLHVLISLKEELAIRDIRALHLHHGIRGETADRDEMFVKEVCQRLAVPLIVRHANVKEEAKKAKETCEQTGRRLRYAFFEEEVATVPHAKIATAHNADDQAETVLMHLMRGCGVAGLGGIPYKRDQIIRPLLDCTREEIETFCSENNISYVTDESNFSLQYDRNKVRHLLVPTMNSIYPHAVSAINRLAKIVQSEETYWHKEIDRLLKKASSGNNCYKISELLDNQTPVLRRLLLEAAKRAGATQTEHRHVEMLSAALLNNGTVNLPGDIAAVADFDALSFVPFKRHCTRLRNVSISLNDQNSFYFGDHSYKLHVLSQEEFQKSKIVHKNLFYFCFSCDMINTSDIFLRSRREGDRFRPYGRRLTKTLKKLFSEARVPLDKRDQIPVICDQNGILLVAGFGPDERCAVTNRSEKIIWLEKTESEDL